MSEALASCGNLQHLRRQRGWPVALLVLLCYGLAGAVVPPGHMAAPLASGTVFHLCPGDLRSAQVLDALAPAAAPAAPHAHHHQGHSAPVDEAGPSGPSLTKSHADPGCSFAGAGNAATPADEVALLLPPGGDAVPVARPVVPLWQAPNWVRPPVRSPPR